MSKEMNKYAQKMSQKFILCDIFCAFLSVTLYSVLACFAIAPGYFRKFL